MRYPPTLLDDIRARLPVSQVVGRKVALKRAGREFKGLSPFKVEKSPSFFVNDQKGFYHCFASGEHGDIFSFVMKSEGLSFTEAVERLAADAGVVLPKSSERSEEKEDERARLYGLLEESARFFQNALGTSGGQNARRYVSEKRGLTRETVTAFRIGYAPESRSALKDHLAAAGFHVSEMALAGMIIAGDDISIPYDRFRHRVMFPITDQKGRVIAFGGRAMDANAPAKYLNSPETPLFHKGHVLFNAAKARPAAFDRGELIVVEGYMDVVALSQAGFAQAVAPLGTALTVEQIQLLWRMVPEPTLCFDGDNAGRKAAFRAVETVLPALKPGFSLRFAFLPDGLDPDDLARQQGPGAVRAVLDQTRPLSEMLFEREFQSGDWSTPERRARLEQLLGAQLRRIEDPSIRTHYGQAMRERLAATWGQASPSARTRAAADPKPYPAAPWSTGGNRSYAQGRYQPGRGGTGPGTQQRGPRGAVLPDPRTARSPSLKGSRMVGGGGHAPPTREALILKSVLTHPWLLEDHAEELAGLDFTVAALAKLRDALLAQLANDNYLDSGGASSQLHALGFGGLVEYVERAITHKSDRFIDASASHAEVLAGWQHVMMLHQRHVSLRKALEAAEQAYHQSCAGEDYERICEIQRAIATQEEGMVATEQTSA